MSNEAEMKPRLTIDGAFVLTVLNRALAQYYVDTCSGLKTAIGMPDQAERMARAQGKFSACDHILRVVTTEVIGLVGATIKAPDVRAKT